MRKKKNLNGIRILLIVSQLVLLAFVLNWLHAQYKTEKQLLKEELAREFFETQQSVMDSALFIHIVNPFMQDADSVQYDFQFDFSEKQDSVQREIVIISDSMRADFDSAAFVVQGDVEDQAKRIDVFAGTADSLMAQSEIIMKTVSLVIKMTEDSGEFNQIMPELIDTALFRTEFAAKIDSLNRGFELVWFSDDSIIPPLFYSMNYNGNPVGVSVEHYRPYLLKKIIPEILFSLFLLLLTAAAFVFTFRRLKSQMQLNAIRKGFISNISHELKTPVSTIKVALEAIQNQKLNLTDEKKTEYLHMAELETKRLDLLVNQVMHASLMEEGRHPFNPEKSDLKKLAEDALASNRMALDEIGAQTIFNTEEKDYAIEVDPTLIKGVIINMIDNSIKYAGMNLKLKICLKKPNGQFIIDICDNGPGIPEEYRDKIFDQFFRVPAGDTHNVKGNGLGLSYAKQVLELHGGTLTLQSAEEGNTCFRITIPEKQ
ncbi:MAG: hypothetical protein C0592_09985 [Marinilabiliales bacterium]|nr:MAG: hypothetical protein C0592_09985 [Marinilabiliales bacterium]